MDEFIWSPRLMRRMALVGLINCVALQATVAEQPATPHQSASAPAKQDDLSALLKRGWEISPPRAGNKPETAPPRADRQLPEVEPAPAVPEPTVGAAARPVLLEARPVLLEAARPVLPPPVSPAVSAAPAKSSPQPTVVAATRPDLAEPTRPDIESATPQPTVKAAPTEIAATVTPTAPGQTKPADVPNQKLTDKSPTLAPVLPQLPPPAGTTDQNGLQRVEPKVDSSSLAELLKHAPKVTSEAPQPAPATSDDPVKAHRPATADLVEQPLELAPAKQQISTRVRELAANNGFGLLVMDGLELPAEDQVQTSLVKPTSDEIIQSTRLRDVAQRLLQEAGSALRRKADYTARKKATAALRTAVILRDAVDGNNHNSRDLEMAFDAIREARDFGVGTSSVDHATLKRLVAVHETSVLKESDLSGVSSLSAMSSYLEFAHQKLTAAAGQQREASDALLLLGQVEQRVSGALDPIASAVTLTYQRAAADADPTNARAFYEMGKSLDQAGMPARAQLALTKSVQLSPSRHSYEKLLETARKQGDIDTVQYCKQALSDAQLPETSLVRQLQPEVFAAMHRPEPAQMPSQATAPQQSRATQPKLNAQKTSSDVTTMSRIKTWFTRDR